MFEDYKKEISIKELSISSEDIAKYFKGMDNSYFVDMAMNELSKLGDEKAKIGVHFFQAEVKDGAVKVDDVSFFPGEDVVGSLSGCKNIAVYACTISSSLDDKINSYSFDSEPDMAFIHDVLGSIIVEKSSGYILDKVSNSSKEYNLKTSNTLSPGNCGWELSEQMKLFSVLPGKFLGIEVNESGMMHPVKSVSGIIGIGDQVKFKHTDCSLCNSINCIYRKTS